MWFIQFDTGLKSNHTVKCVQNTFYFFVLDLLDYSALFNEGGFILIMDFYKAFVLINFS